MKFRVPYWLVRLLFRRHMDELEQRAELTGKASKGKQWLHGAVQVNMEVEDSTRRSANEP